MDARRSALWLSGAFVLFLVAEVLSFVPLDYAVDGLFVLIDNFTLLRFLQMINIPSLFLLVFIAIFCWRVYRWRAAGAVISSFVLAQVVKLSVHHPRPENAFYSAIGSGFPSVHASFAATVSALAWLALSETKPKNWRIYRIVVVIFSAIVAVSRLFLHVHWFSDVVAGVVLGLACVAWAFVRK